MIKNLYIEEFVKGLNNKAKIPNFLAIHNLEMLKDISAVKVSIKHNERNLKKRNLFHGNSNSI